ncbi:uncharacterized protein LOC128503904 [Spea bombifrons]|uniref:uncharacterized protein LOC128503904 n=1 Tax=Spea bombifrons TaxID=233779 RepID=UPI00234BFEC9|nr:uncharacterized protein LOC128503904 [Spea bombifrons]
MERRRHLLCQMVGLGALLLITQTGYTLHGNLESDSKSAPSGPSLAVRFSCYGNKSSLMVEQPAIIRTEAGTSVTFNCTVKTESPSYNIRWRLGCQDGVWLEESPCHRDRVSYQHRRQQLTINNLTESDSGTYCCHVEGANEMNVSGNGTRLEVSPRSCLSDIEHTNGNSFILPGIVGVETCVIIILLAALVKTWRRKSPDLKNTEGDRTSSNLEDDDINDDINYAEICQRSRAQYPRAGPNVGEIVYAPVIAVKR